MKEDNFHYYSSNPDKITIEKVKEKLDKGIKPDSGFIRTLSGQNYHEILQMLYKDYGYMGEFYKVKFLLSTCIKGGSYESFCLLLDLGVRQEDLTIEDVKHHLKYVDSNLHQKFIDTYEKYKEKDKQGLNLLCCARMFLYKTDFSDSKFSIIPKDITLVMLRYVANKLSEQNFNSIILIAQRAKDRIQDKASFLRTLYQEQDSLYDKIEHKISKLNKQDKILYGSYC